MTYLAKTPDGLLPCPHCGGEGDGRVRWCLMADAAVEVAACFASSAVLSVAVGVIVGLIARHMDRW